LIVLAAVALFAQDSRGRVQGVVTDTSGARVVGAAVTLQNVNTGVNVARMTSSLGQYLFDYVDPGLYTITAEMSGFGKTVQNGVQVPVRGDVTVDFTLKVQSASETVTVTDAPPAVQFNSASMEMTVDRKMIGELPVLSRNPLLMATLDSAVTLNYGNMTSAVPYKMWYGSSLDLGGSTSQKNDVLLDGTPSQVGAKASYQPSMDAVEEFAVQQNAVDAEFGHSAGGSLAVSMKSGTNQYHGTAYYFGQNPKLNAVSNAVVRTANLVRKHMWGGTLGGPIKRNKLFNFFSYEQWRYSQPASTILTLPTERERKGDFSQSLTQYGGLRTIYDPYTTETAGGKITRQPFAGNIIPAARIDATAARMMSDIWLPNSPGEGYTNSRNYRQGYAWLNFYKNFSNRTDWYINDRWKMFGRYSRFDTRLEQANFARSRAVVNPVDGVMDTRNIAFDTVYTLSPSTVLNVRWAFTSINDSYDSPATALSDQAAAELWGGNAWYKPYLGNLPAMYYPYLNIAGNAFGRDTYWFQQPKTYSYFARVSRQQGPHYLKAGTDDRFTRGHAVRPRLWNFYFTATDTANTYSGADTRLSGDGYASFLLGVMDPSRSVAQDIPMQDPRVNSYAGYIQDDYKFNSRIAFQFGLRWEYEPAPYAPDNRLSRYLDLTSPIPEMQATPPKMPAEVSSMMGGKSQIYNGAWLFTDSGNRNMWQSPHVLLPRIGAAIRLDDKSALRIGFARYVAPPMSGVDMLGSMPYPGYSVATYVASTIAGVPGARLSDPFPSTNPLLAATGKGYGRYTNLGGSASWYQNDLHPQTNDRFNVSLQRSLPYNLTVDVTLFANFGRNWFYTDSLNMVDPQIRYTYKTAIEKSVANPFYKYLTAETFPGQLRNQANVALSTLLVPYPQYGAQGSTAYGTPSGSLTQMNTGGRSDRYKSVNVKIKRSFANGHSFLFTYNYNNEDTQNFYSNDELYSHTLGWEKSAAARHRANFFGTLELPFGRGRRLLSAAHPALQAVIGGWSASGILNFVSGDYLQFGQMLATGDPRAQTPANPALWFDTSVFATQPAYTPRTNPKTYSGLKGPRAANCDLALTKTFRLTERARMEFRMDAFNLTNSFMSADPSTTLSNVNFGKSVDQANFGRSLLYGAKIYF
jgi:hypothetical protein